MDRNLSIEALQQGYSGRFQAMGSPCELLCETGSHRDAEKWTAMVAGEAWRIQEKLSRYVDGNIIHRINSANGKPVEVDPETAQLLDFAEQLYSISGAAFDITSGVLRRAWTFDGSDNVPSKNEVKTLLHLVGWDKVTWRSPTLTLPAKMQIDLGGIGKEYAVDRAIVLLRASSAEPFLVNFGGDLAVTGPPQTRKAWTVGIEAIREKDAEISRPAKLIELRQGALATSGDARRFLLKDGIRYGHVIDPRTGWPVRDAASSITVAADTCTQAGMLSTLAMLKGLRAEQFLDSQSEQSWCHRGTHE
jgi:thiamine biosynthesis lipoprotein